MTEEEAKNKWCPMVRDFSNCTLTPAANRLHGAPLKSSMCIGSACMMWRWEDHLTKNGYCGLGGKP